jgi:hypothetical protein
MAILQHSKKEKRNEFSVIYGVTLVAAFTLMSSFQFLTSGTASQEVDRGEEVEIVADAPMASTDKLPTITLKKIFVNKSF